MITAPLVFVFATLMEANPFLRLLAARRIDDDVLHVYTARIEGRSARVVISGMGLLAARQTLQQLFRQYPLGRVVNCGIAGSLSETFAVGDIVNITHYRVLQNARLSDESEAVVRADDHFPAPGEGSLLTVDVPVFDAEQKKTLAPVAQLVDMEGGVIARLCQQQQVPFQLLKVVSDVAEDRQQLHKNIAAVSEGLARHLINHMHFNFNRQEAL